jgi:hypothetical protein
LPWAVAEHLDLDMARAFEHIFLEQHDIASPKASLAASRWAAGERVGEFRGPHRPCFMPLPPPPATALISTG